ncbi:MAG: PilZ domain-containing protein [Deltaproteobacteria bacterium]|nr:PilZ domain-containing protein [Deltaproteobacteria bacterium]
MNTFEPHLHLPITLGTELLLEIVNLKLRTKSVLIGMENSSYLIMKLSSQDFEAGLADEKVSESPLIVRYLFRGSVYGFKTRLLKIIAEPSRLAFLSYPTKIEEFNVRHNPRYECILPAETLFGGEQVELVIVDISLKGCRCVVKTASISNRDLLYSSIDIDREMALRINLPGVEEKLGVKGKIRNINKDNDRVIFGVLFDELAGEAENMLNRFISLISDIEKM